jgi:peptidoglycan hydrolase-like protein with peptidoglycan-binding domain
MSRAILDFSNWKRINEATDYKVRLSSGEKIKLFKIDASSFKVKVVSRVELVGADGKISPEDWNMLKTQFLLTSPVTGMYPGLKDLKTNVVVYSIDRGSEGEDRVELFTFTITPRTAAPGVPANVEYIKQEDLTKTVTDPQKAAILTQTAQKADASKVETKDVAPVKVEPGDTIKLASPLGLDSIKSLKSDSPIFDLVDRAYFQLRKEPKIASLPFMSNLKAELKANRLGDATVLFFKGIIAGYDLKDKYEDPLEVVNQTVIDKVMQMAPPAQNSSRTYVIRRSAFLLEKEVEVGAPATGIAGFNVDAFVKAVGGSVKAASDIKIPEGGLKQGSASAVDETVKAVQKLLIDKLSSVLSGDPNFDKFKKYGADGRYGSSTKTVIQMAKAGFDLAETDGSTITQALVDALVNEKIEESYLNPFGEIHEGFDVAKAKASLSKSTSSKGGSSSSSKPSVNAAEGLKWLESVKPRLSALGTITEGKMKDGTTAYLLKTQSGEEFRVFGNKRIHRLESGIDPRGTISVDGINVVLDANQKTYSLEEFVNSAQLYTALANPTAVAAYIKMMKGLLGKWENEDEVYSALESLKNQMDWEALNVLWKNGSMNLNWMKKSSTDPDVTRNFQSADSLRKWYETRREQKADWQIDTLSKALAHYLDKPEELKKMAEILSSKNIKVPERFT